MRVSSMSYHGQQRRGKRSCKLQKQPTAKDTREAEKCAKEEESFSASEGGNEGMREAVKDAEILLLPLKLLGFI